MSYLIIVPFMINYHYTENNPAKTTLLPENAKPPILRSTYHEQPSTKKQNNLEVTNRMIQSYPYHESAHIKVGRPLRVVLPNHLENGQKKLSESANIDCTAQKYDKDLMQQNEKHTEKMGSKIRHKFNNELEESVGCSSKEEPKLGSQSFSTSSPEVDDQKFVELKEWVSAEISKINHQIALQNQKLQKIHQLPSQVEQKDAFTGPQIQELNRILSLVQKAGNREDYKRTTRMIEDLRANILELHQQLSDLSQQTFKKPLYNSQSLESNSKMNKQIQAQHEVVKRLVQDCRRYEQNLKNGMETVQNLKKELQNILSGQTYRKSAKEFKGKMISFQYEQKLIPHKDQPVSSLSQKNLQPQDEINLTSNVYYIDSEGYLLDSSGFYLINSKEMQIRLTSRQIELLKVHHIL